MLNVGIVGLSPVWETRYAPAFKKVSSRIQVRAVYDVVASRAQMAAQALECEAVQGILSLIARADVQALMILDRGWQDRFPLESLIHCEKPGYIAGSFGDESHFVAALQAEVEHKSLTVMPEFSRRFTPATTRLKELIATRLGPPRLISIDATLPSPGAVTNVPGQMNETDFLVGWFDWCRYVLRAEPRLIFSTDIELLDRSDLMLGIDANLLAGCELPPGWTAPPVSAFQKPPCRTIRIDFQRKRQGQEAPIVVLKLYRAVEPEQELSNEMTHLTNGDGDGHNGPQASHPEQAPPLPRPDSSASTGPQARLQVRCEKGVACLNSDQDIVWSADTGSVMEMLRFDRSEIEVMLDHFCRRVVGGLIPLPDIRDVFLSLEMVRAARASHDSAHPVTL